VARSLIHAGRRASERAFGGVMKLTKLLPGGDEYCNDRIDCPAVYNTDTELVLVQGSPMTHPDAAVPAHEQLVAVPKSLLRALAVQLSEL